MPSSAPEGAGLVGENLGCRRRQSERGEDGEFEMYDEEVLVAPAVVERRCSWLASTYPWDETCSGSLLLVQRENRCGASRLEKIKISGERPINRYWFSLPVSKSCSRIMPQSFTSWSFPRAAADVPMLARASDLSPVHPAGQGGCRGRLQRGTVRLRRR